MVGFQFLREEDHSWSRQTAPANEKLTHSIIDFSDGMI